MGRFNDQDEFPRRGNRKAKPGNRKKESSSGLGLGLLVGFAFAGAVGLGIFLFLKKGQTPTTEMGTGTDTPGQANHANPSSPLAKAVGETDKLDPGWKMDQLISKTAANPAGDNSARVIMEAYKLVPRQHPEVPKFVRNPGLQPLSEQQKGELGIWLRQHAAALKVAETLGGKPLGHFVAQITPDFISTLLNNEQNTRYIADILIAEALIKAEFRNPGKLDEFASILMAANTIGENYTMVGQRIRSIIVILGLQSLEHTLARSNPSGEALGRAQGLLKEDPGNKYILAAFRGERATRYGFLNAIDSGNVSLEKATEVIRGFGFPEFAWPNDRKPGSARFHEAAALELATDTEIVEACKKPLEKQAEGIKAALAKYNGLSRQAPSFNQGVSILFERKEDPLSHVALLREVALRRCALAGIAAERHRLTAGQWPADLSAISKDLLPEIPTDPFTGAPVLFKRLDDGLVIYSVGGNGQDDQGDLGLRELNAPDFGFRLLDPAKRK